MIFIFWLFCKHHNVHAETHDDESINYCRNAPRIFKRQWQKWLFLKQDMSEYKDGRCVGQFRATDREDVEIILTAAEPLRSCQIGINFVVKSIDGENEEILINCCNPKYPMKCQNNTLIWTAINFMEPLVYEVSYTNLNSIDIENWNSSFLLYRNQTITAEDKEVMLHGQGYKRKLKIVAGALGVLFLLGCIPLGSQLKKHFKNSKHRKEVEQQLAKQLKQTGGSQDMIAFGGLIDGVGLIPNLGLPAENADPSPLNTNIPNTPLISRFTAKVTDDRPIQGHHEWLRQVTKKSKKERYIRYCKSALRENEGMSLPNGPLAQKYLNRFDEVPYFQNQPLHQKYLEKQFREANRQPFIFYYQIKDLPLRPSI